MVLSLPLRRNFSIALLYYCLSVLSLSQLFYLNLFLEKKSRPRSWPKVQLRLKKMSTDSSPKSLKGFSFFSSPPPLQLQLRNQRPPRHQCWPLKNTPNGRMHQSILPHAGHHPKGLASAPSVQAVVKNKWDTKKLKNRAYKMCERTKCCAA